MQRSPVTPPNRRALWRCRVALFGLAAAGAASAEEGGSGHYAPGSIASFVDTVPAKETFLLRLNILNYEGSASKRLPIGGNLVASADASSWAYGITAVWRPRMAMPEGWSYAVSATVPYLSMDISGTVESGPSALGARSDKATALGDLVLMPLMLNYVINPDLSTNFRIAAYAPTGSYQVGRLANTGKNFWTVEPTVALMYFGQKNGIEASLFAGMDFNWENPDTDYKSGTQFHFDGTLAQHFPFAGGLAGAGLSGYYYQQITDDSGAGATLGAFRGRTVGIGPVLSFVGKLGGRDVIAELKWLHETETQNRLEGDTVWFKFIYKFH